MSKNVMLLIDNSEESCAAEDILKENNISYIPVLFDDDEDGVPAIIYEGFTYRGIDGIKIFLGTEEQLINKPKSTNYAF